MTTCLPPLGHDDIHSCLGRNFSLLLITYLEYHMCTGGMDTLNEARYISPEERDNWDSFFQADIKCLIIRLGKDKIGCEWPLCRGTGLLNEPTRRFRVVTC
jgi:hypothetical protein